MIASITSKVIKGVPYVGPVIQDIAIALDVQAVVENSTPGGAVKIILNECIPPENFIAGKYVIFGGVVIASRLFRKFPF